MSWFHNKKAMNKKKHKIEEITEEKTEEFTVKDRRRIDPDGEIINVEANDDPKTPVKSPEVVRLENELDTVKTRCQVAETKLVDVQKRFDEAKANLERETAELRTRMTKTLEQRAKQDQFNFLAALLPVLDNLNLAIDASAKDSSFQHLLDGVKGTARSFAQALVSVGVKPVESIGAKFDPELHEAVDMVLVEPDKDEIITAEYSPGYLLGERLLRPARVQVGKAIAERAGAE